MPVVPEIPLFADGTLDSSRLNQVRDSWQFLANPPLAKIRQATLQSVANSSFVSLTFDNEDFDSAGGHDTVTNNSRYTAVYPGMYEAAGGVTFAANATGRRMARWAVNGAVVAGSLSGIPANASVIGFAARTVQVYLNVGDYIELMAFQDSGAALNTFVGNSEYQPTMTVKWIST